MKKLEKDAFAKFIAEELLKMDMYNFDMFYDIHKIIDQVYNYSGISDKAIYTEYHLLVRNTGCDMIQPDDENYNIYLNRSMTGYKLRFCFNRDYFHNIPFCEITEL